MKEQDQKRLYLQTIFDFFHEKAEWPTYRYVDRKLFKDVGIDAKEISASLPNGFANGFHFNNDLSTQAMLSLEAIRTCNGSEEDLANFLTAVCFLVEIYKQSEEDNPFVTNTDLRDQLHMTNDAIARIGKLIAGESILHSSLGMATNGSGAWNVSLDREIRRFDRIASLEDLVN